MNRKIYWGFGILIILITGIFVFVYMKDKSEIRELEKQLEIAKQIEKNSQPITKNELPPAPAGYKWIKHGNHHELVLIDAPDTRHDAPQESPIDVTISKTEPVQVKSVVINGVGDLKEYLTFFQSFGDDPSLKELHKLNYNEKAIEYGISMRDFDYENASQLEKETAQQIREKITTLNSIWASKFDVEWQKLRSEPELPEDFRATIAIPDRNEGGDE